MSKKIFVVEDDQKNLDLFLAILNTMPNLEIMTEMDGQRAFEQIKKEPLDIIILDIQLPRMSGIDIYRELKKIEKFKTIPIIAVTALAMKGDKERILEAGFDAYISKPIIIKEFRNILNNFLSKKLK